MARVENDPTSTDEPRIVSNAFARGQVPGSLLNRQVDEFWLQECVDIQGGIEHWRAVEVAADGTYGAELLIFRAARSSAREPSPAIAPENWLDWEAHLRLRLSAFQSSQLRKRFDHGPHVYLACTRPHGESLWNRWDQLAKAPWEQARLLVALAKLFRRIHQSGAVLAGLRVEQILIAPNGTLFLDPSVCYLPFPCRSSLASYASWFSPPELRSGFVLDARADLYNLGSVIYALELGHELSELDMTETLELRPFLERFPHVRPALGQIVTRLVATSRDHRYPVCSERDRSGFEELIEDLERLAASSQASRFEVGASTSSGMRKADNEDALRILHSVSLGFRDASDRLLIVLADGLGGCNAGEVASHMAVDALQHRLIDLVHTPDLGSHKQSFSENKEPESIRQRIVESLKSTNQLIHRESKRHMDRYGMGCTAEVVYCHGPNLFIGHVGDCRTYLLHHESFTALTHCGSERMTIRGTTLRGTSEPPSQTLGRAGGVEPEIAQVSLSPGDWLILCSDGLYNALDERAIAEICRSGRSAHQVARQLVNLANLARAQDNVSVVAVRIQ